MKIIEGGNIFDSNCIALVNPVNCVGVCGAGLALQFKHRYPKNYQDYRNICKSGSMKPGTVLLTGMRLYPLLENESDSKIIVNFSTKDHWKNPSKLEYIRKGLLDLAYFVYSKGIISIAFPLLGCGLGGLNKDDVISLISSFDSKVNKEMECYMELYV